MDGPDPHHRHLPPGSTAASVIARWEDRRMLLRLADGSAVQAHVPAALQDALDVGDEVWVVLGGDGSVADLGRRSNGSG